MTFCKEQKGEEDRVTKKERPLMRHFRKTKQTKTFPKRPSGK